MNPDLEAIVAADEEARARVEAAQNASEMLVNAARADRERRRQERYDELRTTLEEEERRIREAADQAVAERQAKRARYRETTRQAAETALPRAAELYARLVADGPAGTVK